MVNVKFFRLKEPKGSTGVADNTIVIRHNPDKLERIATKAPRHKQ